MGAFFVQFIGSTIGFLQILCCKALLKYMCIAVYLLVSNTIFKQKNIISGQISGVNSSLFPLKAKTNCKIYKNCLNILY